MSVRSGHIISGQFTTCNPTTGAAQDADVLPTGVLIVNGANTADVVTVANIATGVYRYTVTLPAMTTGQRVQVRIAATVATIAGAGIVLDSWCEDQQSGDLFAIMVPVTGTISASTLNSVTISAGLNPPKGGIIILTSGTQARVPRLVVDYDPVTGELWVFPPYDVAPSVGSGYSIIPGAVQDHWGTLAIIGDSISSDVVAYPKWVSLVVSSAFRHKRNYAVDGHSIIANMAGDVATMLAYTGPAPDDLIIALGANDFGTDAVAIQAIMTAQITAIQAAYPACRIYVRGVLPNNLGRGYATVNAAILAACTACRVQFWDTEYGVIAPRVGLSWIDTATQLLDLVHPNWSGHMAIAAETLARLRACGHDAPLTSAGAVSIAAGAIEYTYTVTNTSTGLPQAGVDVWISTDNVNPPVNIIWRGTTDAFGVLRDIANRKPWLDAGTYYFWLQDEGFSATNPDTEVVS